MVDRKYTQNFKPTKNGSKDFFFVIFEFVKCLKFNAILYRIQLKFNFICLENELVRIHCQQQNIMDSLK